VVCRKSLVALLLFQTLLESQLSIQLVLAKYDGAQRSVARRPYGHGYAAPVGVWKRPAKRREEAPYGKEGEDGPSNIRPSTCLREKLTFQQENSKPTAVHTQAKQGAFYPQMSTQMSASYGQTSSYMPTGQYGQVMYPMSIGPHGPVAFQVQPMYGQTGYEPSASWGIGLCAHMPSRVLTSYRLCQHGLLRPFAAQHE